MSSSTRLDQILANSERIGVIGSPSSTSELSLDILGTAASRKLVGEFALFEYTQDSKPNCALGQITEVELRNVWHEDPTMRSLIRQRGRVDAVSARQDTHLAQMTVSAVFADTGDAYQQSILGTVPSTGTAVLRANDAVFDELLRPYQDQLFYLGTIYGSEPKLPLWFKHFGHGKGGAGEAYHLGIFGKTGSGKSVLAKMILTAYARHESMGILVVDPQGEFAKDLKNSPSGEGFEFPLRGALNAQGRSVAVHTIRNLVLDTWELFQEVLKQSALFRMLTIHTADKQALAGELLVTQLRKSMALGDVATFSCFEKALRILSDQDLMTSVYADKKRIREIAEAAANCNKQEWFETHWRPLGELFRQDRTGAVTIFGLLQRVFALNASRPIVVLDLSFENVDGLKWNEDIQTIVISRVIDLIKVVAEDAYRSDDNLNALIVIDEAHRLAPQSAARSNGSDRSIRSSLVDAARTTRKFGLGWMFISQTLSSLDSEIVYQLRINFFGFGLSMGTEFDKLREMAGTSSSLKLYQSFQDPHSSFDISSRKYSFMTTGPVSPLSFAGTPLFFNAFNSVDDFLQANGLNANQHTDTLVHSSMAPARRLEPQSPRDALLTMNQRMLLLGDLFEGGESPSS